MWEGEEVTRIVKYNPGKDKGGGLTWFQDTIIKTLWLC